MQAHRALLAFALTLVATPCLGQIAARQGNAEDLREFKSPMILELPLPDPTELAPNTTRHVSPEIQHYTCEGVSLASLVIGPSPKRGRSAAPFQLTGHVRVPTSYDRIVRITFELKKGDEVLARAAAQEIDAEEGRSTPFSVGLPVNKEALQLAYASDPPPVLQVTVVVVEN